MSQNEETQIPDQLPVTEFNKYELAQNKQHLPQWRQKSLFSINSIVVCLLFCLCDFSPLPTLCTDIEPYSQSNICWLEFNMFLADTWISTMLLEKLFLRPRKPSKGKYHRLECWKPMSKCLSSVSMSNTGSKTILNWAERAPEVWYPIFYQAVHYHRPSYFSLNQDSHASCLQRETHWCSDTSSMQKPQKCLIFLMAPKKNRIWKPWEMRQKDRSIPWQTRAYLCIVGSGRCSETGTFILLLCLSHVMPKHKDMRIK